LILASKNVSKDDLEESSPDHLGEPLETADTSASQAPRLRSGKPPAAGEVIPAALISHQTAAAAASPSNEPAPAQPIPAPLPVNGTVVLDVESGGIVVPSFIGKSVRAAIEQAETSGLEMDALGSGIAHDQSPAPGSHVTAGSTVLVKFER
jgi:cell division protein FtsI (penicillin-binding protein 3)